MTYGSRYQTDDDGNAVTPCYGCPVAQLADEQKLFDAAKSEKGKPSINDTWGMLSAISAANSTDDAAAKATRLKSGNYVLGYPCTRPRWSLLRYIFRGSGIHCTAIEGPFDRQQED